jgi:hypothetical protein
LISVADHDFLGAGASHPPEQVRPKFGCLLPGRCQLMAIMFKNQVLNLNDRQAPTSPPFPFAYPSEIVPHLGHIAPPVKDLVNRLTGAAYADHEIIEAGLAQVFKAVLMARIQIGGYLGEDSFAMKHCNQGGQLGMKQWLSPIEEIGADQVIAQFVEQSLHMFKLNMGFGAAAVPLSAGGAIRAAQIAGIGHVHHGDVRP